MIPLIIFTIAVLFLVVAVYKVYTTSQYMKTSEVVHGKVVGYDYGEHSSTSNSGQGIGAGGVNVQTTMNPLIQYVTKSGEVLTLRSTLGAGSLPEGELTVRYSTIDPKNAEVNSFITNWFVSLLLSVIGGLLLVVGLLAKLVF